MKPEIGKVAEGSHDWDVSELNPWMWEAAAPNSQMSTWWAVLSQPSG